LGTYLVPDRADPQNRRVVIIGAGIGGLSAALRLAASRPVGRRRRHGPGPGGKMRTRDSAAGPVDIGPTVMTMRHVFEEMFAEVGERLEDHVTLHADTVLARHWWRDGSTLDLHANPELSARLSAISPAPEGGGGVSPLLRQGPAPVRGLRWTRHAGTRAEAGALTAHVMKAPGLIPSMAPG
jgi:1-hydroxycarotenoid 3,4-desaturase